jgi:threonine/homoserine/homoserine lactone efflux protein
MEKFFEFAAVVIIISLSGVILPGPLFAANIFYGLKGGTKTGLKIAYGHTVVELPLVFLLGIGAFSLTTTPEFRIYITIISAIGLFVVAGLQLRRVFQHNIDRSIQPKYGPFFAGIILTGLNPFFLFWWLTIGFKLISESLYFWSFWGIGIMFLLHIWMDYVWLSATALMSLRLSKILSNKHFKFVILVLSGVLVYFGLVFLIDEFG